MSMDIQLHTILLNFLGRLGLGLAGVGSVGVGLGMGVGAGVEGSIPILNVLSKRAENFAPAPLLMTFPFFLDIVRRF